MYLSNKTTNFLIVYTTVGPLNVKSSNTEYFCRLTVTKMYEDVPKVYRPKIDNDIGRAKRLFGTVAKVRAVLCVAICKTDQGVFDAP